MSIFVDNKGVHQEMNLVQQVYAKNKVNLSKLDLQGLHKI